MSWENGQPRKGTDLEDRLKSLMQDLGNAINESLSESDRIGEAIGEIKGAGYDVFLVIEATIGFNKREHEEGEEPEAVQTTSAGKIRLTSQDQRFLKELCIKVEDSE